MKHKTRRQLAFTIAVSLVMASTPLTLCREPELKKPIETRQTLKSTQPTATLKTIKPIQAKLPTKRFRVTAYTGVDKGQNGKDITASGIKAKAYETVAASSSYPFGTVLEDAETHERYIVQDRGGAIKGDKIDLYVGHSNTNTAMKFGVQYRDFYIIFPTEEGN